RRACLGYVRPAARAGFRARSPRRFGDGVREGIASRQTRSRPMKQVLLERYGLPEEGVRCVDVPDVGAPGAGEVVFDVLAFPINPADVWMCRGSYRLKPALPATPGAECIGRVTAVGAGVGH